MWIALSIVAVAIGAVLDYAVADSVDGANLHTIGAIIMLAGVAGFVISVIAEFLQRHRTVDRQVDGPGGRYVERERQNF